MDVCPIDAPRKQTDCPVCSFRAALFVSVSAENAPSEASRLVAILDVNFVEPAVNLPSGNNPAHGGVISFPSTTTRLNLRI
jgi:hypothetical protein